MNDNENINEFKIKIDYTIIPDNYYLCVFLALKLLHEFIPTAQN